MPRAFLHLQAVVAFVHGIHVRSVMLIACRMCVADIFLALEGVVLEGIVLEGIVLEGIVLEGIVPEGVPLEGLILEWPSFAPTAAYRAWGGASKWLSQPGFSLIF